MPGFNPLLDSKPKAQEAVSTITASESIEASDAPLSPADNMTPMVHLKCRNVDVWVDKKNRLVLPFKK